MIFVFSESKQVLLCLKFPATFYRRGFWFPQPLRRQNYSFPVKVDTVLEIFPSSVLDIMMAARLKLFCLGYKKNRQKKTCAAQLSTFQKMPYFTDFLHRNINKLTDGFEDWKLSLLHHLRQFVYLLKIVRNPTRIVCRKLRAIKFFRH